MSTEIQTTLPVSEQTRNAKQTQTIVFPYGLLKIDTYKWGRGANNYELTNNGGIQAFDVFNAEPNARQTLFAGNSWSMLSTSAAKQIANLVQFETAIPNANAAFFRFLQLYEPDERAYLTKMDWKTRQVDKTSSYELSAAAFSNFWLNTWGLIELGNKNRSWLAQVEVKNIDGVDETRQVIYKDDDPSTWLPKLYIDHVATISASDQLLLDKLLDAQLEYRWCAPAECYIVADKLRGYIEYDLLVDPESHETITQHIDVLEMDPDISKSPKFTTTEDGYLRDILTNLSQFWRRLEKFAKFMAYQQAEHYTAFIKAWTPIELSKDWLFSWPKMDVPWPVYWLRTHYDTPQTRYELIINDYNASDIMAEHMLTRTVSDMTDAGNYLTYRKLPGYTDDQIRCALVYGFFYVAHFFQDGFDANQEWIDTSPHEFPAMQADSQGAMVAVFQAIEYRDTENSVIETLGHPVPTKGSATVPMTEDKLYTIWNLTDNAPFDAMFQFTVEGLPTPSQPTDTPLSVSGSTFQKDYPGQDIIDRVYPPIRIAAEDINRRWTRRYMSMIHNPTLMPPKPTPPERQSDVKVSNYASSKDVAQLELLVNDLLAEIKYFKSVEQYQQVKNRQVAVERVQNRINRLKDAGSSQKKVDPEMPHKTSQSAPDVSKEMTESMAKPPSPLETKHPREVPLQNDKKRGDTDTPPNLDTTKVEKEPKKPDLKDD
jgi:hypothetical protein